LHYEVDVEFNTDTDGVEFLEFTERQTKSRTGINTKEVRVVPLILKTG